jgi:DNA-binding NarL/FixJ family response regulator
VGTLTPRQLDIVRLVAKALTNKQIALALEISEQTVKNHLMAAYRRMQVSGRFSIVVAALQQGLLSEADLEAPHVDPGVHWGQP